MLRITHSLDLPYWWSWPSDLHIPHSLPILQSRQVISPQGCWIFARGHCGGELFGNSPETVCVQTDVDLSSTWRLPAEQRKQSSFVPTSTSFVSNCEIKAVNNFPVMMALPKRSSVPSLPVDFSFNFHPGYDKLWKVIARVGNSVPTTSQGWKQIRCCKIWFFLLNPVVPF